MIWHAGKISNIYKGYKGFVVNSSPRYTEILLRVSIGRQISQPYRHLPMGQKNKKTPHRERGTRQGWVIRVVFGGAEKTKPVDYWLNKSKRTTISFASYRAWFYCHCEKLQIMSPEWWSHTTMEPCKATLGFDWNGEENNGQKQA